MRVALVSPLSEPWLLAQLCLPRCLLVCVGQEPALVPDGFPKPQGREVKCEAHFILHGVPCSCCRGAAQVDLAGVNRGTTQCCACSFVCFLTSAHPRLICLPYSSLIFPGFLLLGVERAGRLNPIPLPFYSVLV